MTAAEPVIPGDPPSTRDQIKGIYFIAISQFGIAFSFNCIMSFMPFYILKVSAYGMKETMLWIGMIMGSTSLVAALAAPFWGSLTVRVRPKLLFEAGILCNGILFFAMGFVENLPLLLALRLIQGALGAISTIGLVLIAASAPKHSRPRYLGLFQNSMTAGQLIGPPLGAYAVTIFGYHSPFIIAVIVVFFSSVILPSSEQPTKAKTQIRKKTGSDSDAVTCLIHSRFMRFNLPPFWLIVGRSPFHS